MSLHLYNTLTNREDEFVPINKDCVTIYTCGPTVYGRPHIGNYSSFLMADLVCRWLEVSGYGIRHVKNITDVGHLVADGDDGEDKVEKQAREEHGEVTHESVIAIARKYEAEYLEDEKLLNMREPQERPRATDYVDGMKEMIEDLLKKGHAYETSDGIYFDVTTKGDYGCLSGNTLDHLDAGSRVSVNEEKKHPADFALWKFCVGQNEHHALRWSSPGEGNPEGFPGWHIECSAMSRSLLGDQIDIHTGGEDNIFPHHECEIAQTECFTCKAPFSRYWVHRRRIDMGSEKMSKSLGNVLNLDDIQDMGYSPLDLRYYFLSVHYRTNLKFTEKGLSDAKKARKKIVEWIQEMSSVTSSGGEKSSCSRLDQFKDAMDADLNTPAALAVIFDYMSWSRTHENWSEDDQYGLSAFIHTIQNTFGCFESESQEIPQDVQELLEKRQTARENKDFAASDALRDEISSLGWVVKDTAEGQVLQKKD